ncbi:MAG TPA: hypothetical protein DIW17_09490, partial [Clostridiales bacterium]|nr:hypothetical protein [Clostridiales bacterium]
DTDYKGIIGGILQWVVFKDTKWDGLMKGKKLESLMKKWTEGKWMRESNIPLAITAVDINTGRTVIFVSSKRKLDDDLYTIYRDDVPI